MRIRRAEEKRETFLVTKATEGPSGIEELTIPEKLCRFYVERPKLAFGITLSIQLSTVLATAILYLIGYDILPYDFGKVPLNLEKDATKLRADAFNFVSQDTRINLLPTTILGQPERSLRYSPIELFFSLKEKNVLTAKNLKDIDNTEKRLYNDEIFQKKICNLNYVTGNCSLPLSIIRLFDGTYRKLNPDLFDPEFRNIEKVLRVANNISITRALVAFSLDIHSVINNDIVRAGCVRSVIFNGFPLKGYRHAEDRKDEQTEELNKYTQKAFADTLKNMYKDGVGSMDLYYNNLALFFDAIDKQVIYDLLLAAGSFLFIFCFIWVNTGSLWITSWALLGILTNFFGANLVYRVLLDFRYIGIFHVLSVFIILGIGADDVFVFFNTWKLMEQRKYPNLIIHLTETFRCAASAMFVTSLTTMAAFLASAASPLLAVSSFGVFSGPYVDYVILHPIVRWIVLAFFVVTSVVFMSFAVQLRPDEEQVQVWKPGTNWHDIRHIRMNNFKESGEGSNVIRVYLIWGLGLQDRRKCHFTDYKCRGETIFDEDFDLNAPNCQLSVLEFCKRLKSLTPEEAEKLKIRRSVATGELEVSCFMEKMQSFLKSETKARKFSNEANISLPIDERKAKIIMQTRPIVYNETMLSGEYKRFFEVGLGYWLSNGGNPNPGYNYFVYGNWIGGSLDPTAMPYLANPRSKLTAMAQGGRFGNRLRYAAVVVNTSLTGATMKYQEGNIVYDNWEKFVNEQTADMPRHCKNMFQCTPEWNNWHWLKVQWVLLVGAVQGIIIGLALALPVLIFTTCNWIIGLLAALTISLITNAVVGLIPLLGWKLGVMESLNLTLVVGLAVDYCVHLADGYVRSKKTRRVDRLRDMLRTVGVSVLSGACTTLGASAFMLGSQIMFFCQFGIFMFCTIGFSIIFALGFFTVAIGFIGPEGDRGSLKHCFTCFFPRRSEGENRNEFSVQEFCDVKSGCSASKDNIERTLPGQLENLYTPTIIHDGDRVKFKVPRKTEIKEELN
eukprot:gene2676-884_t